MPPVPDLMNRSDRSLSYAGGWADIEAGRKMQSNTTMMVCSSTKTITAAAVLQLVEQGRINLDDPVNPYLSDIPYGKELKVRHLLSQTSGIPNSTPLRWIHLVEEHPRFDQKEALRSALEENAELKFTPGKQFAYSNISYWLLGYLIERVSGLSYEQYVRQHIFSALLIPDGEIDFVMPSSLTHAKGYLPKWSWMNIFKSLVVDPKFAGDYEDG